MQAGHYASLLPELFRHKTTRVRVFQPQVVLLDFHGTISERRWEDKVIFPYVRKTIRSFMRDNWNLDSIQKCIPALRNESFEQRFRYKYDDAPLISDQVDGEELDPVQLAEQMADFLIWQMATKRETKETQLIERLVWLDGFQRHQIQTPIYDDVMTCVKAWHEHHSIGIYVISSIDSETLKLLFENTDKGNLHQHLAGYLSSRKPGDKLISETYKQFYDKVSSRSPNASGGGGGGASGSKDLSIDPHTKSSRSPPQRRSDKVTAQSSTDSSQNGLKAPASTMSFSKTVGGSSTAVPPTVANQTKSTSRSLSGTSNSSGTSPVGPQQSDLVKPILFLTDSGQEAKAASQVADGSAFECLLVNRPGNKRIRTYYLSQFQYVDKFDDIEFV